MLIAIFYGVFLFHVVLGLFYHHPAKCRHTLQYTDNGKVCFLDYLILRLFALILCVSVNSYGHVKTVSSPDNTFSWASLTKRLTSTLYTYFCLLLTTRLPETTEGGWQFKLFHYQSPRLFGTGPGSNWRPLDLQSAALPTALRGPVIIQ